MYLRASSRLVALFAPDVPSSPTAPARQLYELFQDRLVARRLTAHTYWIFGPRAVADNSRGRLYSNRFAFQYAARAQALLHFLASVWLSPTVSQKNKAMLAEALPTAKAVCHRQMIHGSVAKCRSRAKCRFTIHVVVARNAGRVCAAGA